MVMSGIVLLALIVVGLRRVGDYLRAHKRRREALDLPVPPSSPPILLSPEPGAGLKGPYNIPTFGSPVLEIYMAADYEIPLVCIGGCHKKFADGEKFYFIPLPDQSPGSGLGLCTLCYGKAIPA